MSKRPIGVVIGAHGIRGLVKVKTDFGNFKVQLEKQPVTIRDKTYSAKVVGATQSPFIVQLEGISDRNAAEGLRGEVLRIKTPHPCTGEGSSGSAAAGEGEYNLEDLIGFTVEEHGKVIGKIKATYNFGAGDILEIAYPDGKTEMFAFNKRTFPDVDMAAERAVFARPEEI